MTWRRQKVLEATTTLIKQIIHKNLKHFVSFLLFLKFRPVYRQVQNQHNDTQHNDTQDNDTQHNDTQLNDIKHNDTQHKNLISETQHK
jgi:hypothetical protein